MTFTSYQDRRRGFTLLEVLVVISIIAVLAALVVSATFQVVEGQRQTNTVNSMRTLSKILQAQIKAVLDKAEKEPIPNSVMTMAGNDPKRARVIWKKLRLRQEFPMSVAEALAPWSPAPVMPPVLPCPPNPNPSPTIATVSPPSSMFSLSTTDLPAKPFFENKLQSDPGTNQSAVLLLLTLELSRGGSTTFTTDNLGSGALFTNTFGFREVVDGWGVALEFYRFPTGNPDLDASNPLNTGKTAKFRDPLDPEGTLLNASWNNWNNYNTQQGVYWFEQLCHPVHTGVGPGYAPVARYMFPVLVSAGRNNKLGLDLTTRDMSVAPGMQNDANDNIYSFLLK